MNFFNSVFTDEPTPPDSPHSSPGSPQNPDPNQTWSFGGLIKTLATKSESMIENYRKDLEEFGSGIRKETSVIREVASRAVKDLPGSLEVGASIAQESLETVGQAIDDIGATVWKSTSKIISHGKDSFLAHDNDDSESSDKQYSDGNIQPLKRYSRFDMQVRNLQCDLNTYCTEPEDEIEYEQWRLAYFSVDEQREEIDSLFSENRVIREIYDELVPSRVDNEGFWSRYFFKLHKLKQAEEARALLVKRAISGEDEDEDLRWDFDDEVESSPQRQSGENKKAIENASEEDKVDVKSEEKGDNGDSSCKDSDLTVVSTQSSPEEDLGWDEIEEIGMNGDTLGEEAMGNRTSTSRLVDLRKRLSAPEEDDEDLNWDIEDQDDEPGNH